MPKSGVAALLLSRQGKLTPSSYEILTAGRKLADASKEPFIALIFQAAGEALEISARGPDKVISFESPALQNFDAALYAETAKTAIEKENIARVLIPSSVNGRALAGALAVSLKAAIATDAAELAPEGAALKIKRPQFAGNVLSEVLISSEIQIVTIQPMVFPKAEKQEGKNVPIEHVTAVSASAQSEFVSFQPDEAGEIDLGGAEKIVSGGRGLGNAEGFKLIYEFAQTIKAAVGASRAVVDPGWIAYKHQVGLTGKTVHPKLYIACGISGQIQHLAGMSSSGTIVAINTDPTCPLMQMASISVLGDVYEIVPKVIAEIKKRKGLA